MQKTFGSVHAVMWKTLRRRKQMSKMSIKVSFTVGVSLREALTEAREKAEKLGVAFIEFSFNGAFFAVSPQADIERGIEEFEKGMKAIVI